MSYGEEHAQHTKERLMAEIRALKSANDALQCARGPFSMYGSTSALPDGQTLATLYAAGLVAVTSVGANGRRVLNVGSVEGMRRISAQKMASVGAPVSKDDLDTRVKKERRGALFVETYFSRLEGPIQGGVVVPARHALGDHLRDFPEKYRAFVARIAEAASSKSRATGSSYKVMGLTTHEPWMCGSDGSPLEGVPVMPLCEEFSKLRDVVLLVNPSCAAPVQSSMVSTSAPCPARAPACSQLIASLSAIGFKTMDLSKLKVPSKFGDGKDLVNIIERLHEGAKKGPFMALSLPNDQLDVFRATMFSFCFPSATPMRTRPFPPELAEPVPYDQDYPCIMTQCIGRTLVASQFGVPCVADMNLQCSSVAVSISAAHCEDTDFVQLLNLGLSCDGPRLAPVSAPVSNTPLLQAMTTHRGPSTAQTVNASTNVGVSDWQVVVAAQGQVYPDDLYGPSALEVDDAIAHVLGASSDVLSTSTECAESAFGIPFSDAGVDFYNLLALSEDSVPPPPYHIPPNGPSDGGTCAPSVDAAGGDLDSDEDELECNISSIDADADLVNGCSEVMECDFPMAESDEELDSDDEELELECILPPPGTDEELDSDEETELEFTVGPSAPLRHAVVSAAREESQAAPPSPLPAEAAPIACPSAHSQRERMAGSKRGSSEAGHAVSECKRHAGVRDELECASQLNYPAMHMDQVEGYTDGTTSSSASSDTSDSCASVSSEEGDDDVAPVLGAKWGDMFSVADIAAQAERDAFLCRVFVNTHVMQLPVEARSTPVGAELARLRKYLLSRNGAALAQKRTAFSSVMSKAFKNRIDEINVFLRASHQIDCDDLESLWEHCGRTFLFFINSLMLAAAARYYRQEGK